MMVPFCCWWCLPGLIFVYFPLFLSAKFQFGLHRCQLLVNFQFLLRCLYFQSWSKLASYSACMYANTKNAKSLRYTCTSWRHEVLCKKYKLYCKLYCRSIVYSTIKSVVLKVNVPYTVKLWVVDWSTIQFRTFLFKLRKLKWYLGYF